MSGTRRVHPHAPQRKGFFAMGIGRLRRFAASAGIVALTLGAGTLVVSTVATATTAMTATAAVNLRSGPGTSFPILAVLAKGQTVQASGTVTNGWYQVTVADRTGWVYKSYLTSATTTSTTATTTTLAAPATSTTSSSTTTGTVTTTANVNVRTGPSTTTAIVGVAARGSHLATTGAISGTWTQVVYAGTARWIATSYLTAGAVTVPTATGHIRTTASLYLRTAGTSTAPYDGVLPANSIVDTTGRTTAEYTEIVTGGTARWIATRYTTSATTNAPAAPAAPAASGTVYVTVGELYVRATSSPTGTIVGTVTRGTALQTTGTTDGDRTQILYLGTARWVYAPYVTTTAPTTATALSIPTSVTTSGIDRLNPNAKAVVSYVLANFPKIRTIYGYRSSSSYSSDHPNGRAVDVMIANWSDPTMADYGWQVARYFATNPQPYKVNYIIYRQSIFNVAYPERGWRPMEDRGSATANHFDHVHVSVFD